MSRDDNIKTTFERVRSEYGCVVKSNEVKEKKKKHFDHLVLFHSLATFSSICAPVKPFSALLLSRWRRWCKGGIEDQSWVTSLLSSAAGTSTTPWRIRTASKSAHNITLLSPEEQKQQVPCHSLSRLINSHNQRQYLDAKSSQVILRHPCHVSIIRYNNMQVNPDGSLATNQTNESNHNTAKVSTKYTKC